jgi:hypothetical protein
MVIRLIFNTYDRRLLILLAYHAQTAPLYAMCLCALLPEGIQQ